MNIKVNLQVWRSSIFDSASNALALSFCFCISDLSSMPLEHATAQQIPGQFDIANLL